MPTNEKETNGGAAILPFGKHKGERVDEVMRTDPKWIEWIMAQPWFREKHPTLVQVIVNGGAAPDDDTPEHNRMQALFLEPAICAAAYRAIQGNQAIDKRVMNNLLGQVYDSNTSWQYREQRILNAAKEAEDQFAPAIAAASYVERCKLKSQAQSAAETAAKTKAVEIAATGAEQLKLIAASAKRVEFEVSGWDVQIHDVLIELKPTLGDDYPSVLRKMKARPRNHSCTALIVGQFDASGATWSQVVSMFAASGIKAIHLHEITAVTSVTNGDD